MSERGAMETRGPAGARMRRIKVPDAEQPHWCFPLADPHWLAASGADQMRPDDAVLGVEFNGGVWALPWWIMKNHHIANLVLNGKEVLINLCEVCSAAAAFDPIIDGKRYTFKLGGLFNGTIMPQDYETGSLWTGFSGEAIEGPMKGRSMERLPLLQCTWEEWLHLHPGTLVPDGTGESREGHGEGRAPGSPYIGPDMGDLMARLDTRLPHYELVLGVLSGGEARCYPLAVLGDVGGVVNDTLGGNDIVALASPGSWMASAYSRRIDDRTLTFSARDGGNFDNETGSRWEISGRCSSGPLAGTQLKYVNSGVEEFFLWAAFNPKTGIYQPDAAPAGGPAQRQWSATDAVPTPIYAALKQKWFRRGMKLLDIACGDGMIAALLAEVGLDVFAMDASEGNISRAQLHFRGVANLKFAQGDIMTTALGGRRFDAIIDQGFFAGLDAGARGGYVENLAAATAPGGHFLLLFPVPADMVQQRVNNVERMFASHFAKIDARPTSIPDLRSGRIVPGAAFRLQRRS
jgi:2-polyprenyl-3-methyl-5-hydroxy-6-metoxy-1,4-benzoquinol methylase